MANFQTHLNVGILVSAATTLGLHTAGLIQGGQTLPYFTLGVVGSLLPDIDLKTSRPSNALFSALGAVLAFIMTLPLIGRFLPLELALIWGGVFLCVRYGFFEIFSRLTVHRGIWHSWLAIAAAALAVTNVAYWLWRQSPELAWLAGLMVGVGYLTHLCLDEFYSVDLFNRKIKRSFGTALKPFSLANPWSSFGMFMAVLALWWLAPPADMWLERIQTESLADLRGTFDQFRETLNGAWTQVESWLERLLRSGQTVLGASAALD